MKIRLVPGFLDVIVDQRNLGRFGGSGRLGGTPAAQGSDADGRSRILNVPERIDITVLEPSSFTVIARTLSRPDGSWEVPYLSTDLQFTVIGSDRQKRANSAIQDWVYPELMVD